MKRPRPEDAWNSFLVRLDVSRLPFKCALSMREDFDGRHLVVAMTVADIFGGPDLTVHTTHELPVHDEIPDYQRLLAVRNAVLRAVEHELDECLWLDGARQIDPHMARGCLVVWHAPRHAHDPITGARAACKCDQKGQVETVARQADGRPVVTRVRMYDGTAIDPSIDIDLLRSIEDTGECPWGDRHLARGCC